MFRRILLASVALAPLSAPAFAACSDAKPADGTVVICTGTDTKGVKNKDANGVSVTIAAGASVSNAAKTDNHVIHLNDDAIISVHGTLTSTSAKDAINLVDNARVSIDGTVSAPDPDSDGVQAENGLSLTILEGGTITAGKKGVNGGDGTGSTVTNHGTITAGTEGIELGDDGSILNTGTISARDDAINAGENATIVNTGTIHSVQDDLGIDFVQDGIDIDSGRVINSGLIQSDDDAAIDFDATSAPELASVITNSGRILGAAGIIVETGHNDDGSLNGEAANTAAQRVYNLAGGRIEATSGPALKLGAGDDGYFGAAGSVLVGAADLGQGDDLFALEAGAMVGGDVQMGEGADMLSFTGLFGGAGLGLFDGGLGTDVVSFADYLRSDISSLSWSDDILGLTFADGFALSLTSFETVTLGTRSYALSELMPAVPLPAPLLMLGSALGGLALLRRRRR